MSNPIDVRRVNIATLRSPAAWGGAGAAIVPERTR